MFGRECLYSVVCVLAEADRMPPQCRFVGRVGAEENVSLGWVGCAYDAMMPEPGLATSGAQQAVRWICSRWPWGGSGRVVMSVGPHSGCFRFRVVWLAMVFVCEVG